VWLSEGAREALVEAAARAHPREAGGVLLGVTTRGRPWITHATEVRSRKSGSSFYELPSGARRRAVIRLRRKDARVGYLGDWHSHPQDVDPSATDRESMASVSARGDCPRPLLIIVRRRKGGYELDVRQWTWRSLRPLRVIEAGPLPDPDTVKLLPSPPKRRSRTSRDRE
jgi:proteasome lid subunit RPN8/RPN11